MSTQETAAPRGTKHDAFTERTLRAYRAAAQKVRDLGLLARVVKDISEMGDSSKPNTRIQLREALTELGDMGRFIAEPGYTPLSNWPHVAFVFEAIQMSVEPGDMFDLMARLDAQREEVG